MLREVTAMTEPRGRLILAAALVGAFMSIAITGSRDSDTFRYPKYIFTPRLSDGTIDLGQDGYWDVPWVSDFGAKLQHGERVPFLPWTRAMYAYHRGNKSAYEPQGFCLPLGGPRLFGNPYPARFIQTDDAIYILFEGQIGRKIHMDERRLPDPDEVKPTYVGYSVGQWEGDTLVIETVGYNEKTWLNFAGFMHTDELRTIEWITRRGNTLHYEATIIDPGAYASPWTVTWSMNWVDGGELAEYVCQENNNYLIELKDDLGMPFFESGDIDAIWRELWQE